MNGTDLSEIAPILSGRRSSRNETVRVRYPDPQNAVLEVTLDSAGLVILSDTYYPGWQLAIDAKAFAPGLSRERPMHGALVAAGPHRLVYSFAPRSFQFGLIGSIVGLAAWLLFGIVCAIRPIHPVLLIAS